MEKKIYIAPDAVLTGDVVLGDQVNIWYGAVLRGDSGTITVGEGTNIQDKCILHEKTTLGKNCTVGHGAIVHGATIGDRVIIGMGAIILDGAKIGDETVINYSNFTEGAYTVQNLTPGRYIRLEVGYETIRVSCRQTKA